KKVYIASVKKNCSKTFAKQKKTQRIAHCVVLVFLQYILFEKLLPMMTYYFGAVCNKTAQKHQPFGLLFNSKAELYLG
ncbi:MAG: hypothetical protein IJD18_03850, partial [Clostridia bacterium]|nr:hypothetical protein [Clostridia bacterium]